MLWKGLYIGLLLIGIPILSGNSISVIISVYMREGPLNWLVAKLKDNTGSLISELLVLFNLEFKCSISCFSMVFSYLSVISSFSIKSVLSFSFISSLRISSMISYSLQNERVLCIGAVWF